MKDYIDIFKVYLLDEKKSSGNTVESYIRDINQEIGLTKAFCESKITINKAEAMKRISSCKLFLTENCRLMRGVKVDLQ